MSEKKEPFCPECNAVDRRDFIRVVGAGTAAAAAVGGLGLPVRAADEKKEDKKPRPAEALVKELYETLSDDQKKEVVKAYDEGRGTPARLGTYNQAYGRRIAQVYTKAQEELIEKILRAISSGDEGYNQLSRNGKFDTSGSLAGCGAVFFGDPVKDKKYVWLFSGHHLTVRCDGQFDDGVAFGGPLYYGHSAIGSSSKNVFNFQTQSVLSVYDALSEEQRKKAVLKGRWDNGPGGYKFRPEKDVPGVLYKDLTKDQQKLVETVMRTLLAPFRKEDADEVMAILKTNGGIDKIHLSFYHEGETKNERDFNFWRVEGPGFVWNYRILDHVHCFVNISTKFDAKS